MYDFLNYVSDHSTAITLIIGFLIVLVFMIQWITWIFAWGRFSNPPQTAGSTLQSPFKPIAHVLADLFVKVIDDFRHLLALIVIVMFALTLAYVMIRASSPDEIQKGLSAVTSTLGGIIGVILGYYFGESAGRTNGKSTTASAQTDLEIDSGPEQDEQIEPIEEVKSPLDRNQDATETDRTEQDK